MYQSIDDIETDTPSKSGKPSRKWVLPAASLLLGAGILVAYLNFNTTQRPLPDVSHAEAAAKAYRNAISEQDPALRRARLNDYLLTIENGPHEMAVLSQIDVINRYDSEDWETVKMTAYNLRLSKEVKLAALKRYEDKWGGTLLGGREDDINALRAEITDSKSYENLPDRRLEGTESPFSDDIPDDVLAGGLGTAGNNALNLPTEPFIAPQTGIIDVEPLRVKRNREPAYPRRAEQRGIGGVVTLLLNVDADGRVALTELVSVEAENYEDDFVRAAERAALRTRFHPRTENGHPVPVSGVSKTYRFQAE